MLKIFSGDDRVKISQEVKKVLGEGYEVFEGGELKFSDLASLFFGTSLFSEKRKILVKDISENKEVFERIPEYVTTEHTVVIWETKLDKRTAAYKALKKAGVEFFEFKIPEPKDSKEVLNIFEVALRDGEKAVRMVEKIENTQDPYMFFGLLVSQALRKFEWKQGRKEKRVLKELSKLDKQMKSTTFSPWQLLKSFLLLLSSF